MFFSISHDPKNNFIQSYNVGNLYINVDSGWNKKNIDNKIVIYKGYLDSYDIDQVLDMIINQDRPSFTGNFCAIVYDPYNKLIHLKTDRYRSFPVYVNEFVEVTNLQKYDKVCWANNLISIDSDIKTYISTFNIIGVFNETSLSEEDAIKIIEKILIDRTRSFIQHNKLPIRVFLSGGVDSMLVYSYLQRFTDNYELCNYSHFEYDKFWMLNSYEILKNNWGYKQIHHWTTPCIITSGTPGDEFMMRSPLTVDLFLKHYKISMVDLLNDPKNISYMQHTYFNKPENYKIFETRKINPNWSNRRMMLELCNININDFQHWHLGNTLTWTPLRDIEIFKTLLRLPPDILIKQILDSSISMKLIERNKPGLSKMVSKQKNSGNIMENLCGMLFT
jgi:hypothetical protein